MDELKADAIADRIEYDDENFGLLIANVGANYPLILYLVKQISGKSLQEVKLLLANPDQPIVSGMRREMERDAIALEKAGAKIEYRLIDYNFDTVYQK